MIIIIIIRLLEEPPPLPSSSSSFLLHVFIFPVSGYTYPELWVPGQVSRAATNEQQSQRFHIRKTTKKIMPRTSRSSSRGKKTPAKKTSAKSKGTTSSFSFSITDTDTTLWITAVSFFFYGASFWGLQGDPAKVFFDHEYTCNEAKNITLWSGMMMMLQATACVCAVQQGTAADKKRFAFASCVKWMVFLNLVMFNGFKPMGIMVKQQYYTAAALCFFMMYVCRYGAKGFTALKNFQPNTATTFGKAQLFFTLMTWFNVYNMLSQDVSYTANTGVDCWDRVAKADSSWLGTYMMLSIFDISNMMGSNNKALSTSQIYIQMAGYAGHAYICYSHAADLSEGSWLMQQYVACAIAIAVGAWALNA